MEVAVGEVRLRAAFVICWLVIAVTATGCGLVADGNDKGGDVTSLRSMVDEVGYSRLDDAGVQEIVDSRIAKFDLRSGTETLSAVGLEGRRLGPAIGGPSDPEMLLVLDGPNGREIVETRTIMIGVSALEQTLYEIVYWRSAESLDAAIAEVRDGIQRWGYSPQQVDLWIDSVEKHRNDSEKSLVSSGVSPTGLVTSVEVSYEAGKPVVLRYIVHVRPSIYEPETLDAIRRTGMIPPP